MVMAGVWLIVLFALDYLRVSGECANVGESVILTGSETCPGEEMELVRLRKTDASPVRVARLINHVWKGEEAFKGRMEHKSELSVALNSVNYNDQGLYEFSCKGEVVERVQLNVFFPVEISPISGGSVKLPCHAFTAGHPPKAFRWEKDGNTVFELDPSSGQARCCAGFGDRVNVSADWHSTGDLSITLEGVQMKDEGDYSCHILGKDGGSQRGSPAVVRMRVRDQTACTPSLQSRATEGKLETWTSPGLAAAVVFAMATI